MEQSYSTVEFDDSLQMIPTSWIIKDKDAAYWPQFTSHIRFTKAVQKRISPEKDWLVYDMKRILATANKLHKETLYIVKNISN